MSKTTLACPEHPTTTMLKIEGRAPVVLWASDKVKPNLSRPRFVFHPAEPRFAPIKEARPIATDTFARTNNAFQQDGVFQAPLRVLILVEHVFEAFVDAIPPAAVLQHFRGKRETVALGFLVQRAPDLLNRAHLDQFSRLKAQNLVMTVRRPDIGFRPAGPLRNSPVLRHERGARSVQESSFPEVPQDARG